ncbi:MAG: MFS transporter [Candidatus Zixiibacteriota bacterium]
MTVDLHRRTETISPGGIWNRARGAIDAYMASVQMFSRNARLYLIGSFLIGFNYSVFELLLNLYLKELGFVEGQIGYVQSSRAVGMTLIAIPAAMVLSRISLKPLLIGCCLLMTFFSYGLTTWTEFEFLLGFGLLGGMAFAFFRVASGPFYMRNSTQAERTHLFSFSFGTHLLAGMIGSWGSGNLVKLIGDQTGNIILGYQVTLYVALAISLAAVIPLSLIKASPPSAEEHWFGLNREQFRRRGGFYLRLTTVNLLIGIGAGLIIPFLNLYFRDRFGLSPDRIGFYFILLSFGMLAGTLCGPLITPRFGLVRTIVWTQMASIPFMLILAYTHSLYLAVPAFIIRGALMNMGVPINNNFSMELSEKGEQGLVNAILMISWTGSWMFSVALGGNLIERYGYTVVLNVAVALYVLASLAYYVFFSRVEKRREDRNGWYLPGDARV